MSTVQRRTVHPSTNNVINDNNVIKSNTTQNKSQNIEYQWTTEDLEIYTIFIASIILYRYSVPLYHIELSCYTLTVLCAIIQTNKTDNNWLVTGRKYTNAGLLIGCCLIPYLLLALLFTLHSHTLIQTEHAIYIIRTVHTLYWISMTCVITSLCSVTLLESSYDTKATTTQLIAIPIFVTYGLQVVAKYYIQWRSNDTYQLDALHAEATLLTIIVFTGIQYSSQTLLKHSFTLGESIIVATLLAMSGLVWFISMLYSTQIEFLQRRFQHIPHTSDIFTLLCISVLPLTLILGGIVSNSLLKVQKKAVKMDKSIRAAKLTDETVLQCYVVFGATIAVIIYPLLFLTLGTEPFTYVVTQILAEQHRLYIVAYWLICLIIGITIAPLGTTATDKALNKTNTTPNILIRKYYHLLATVLFVPAILIDCTFVTLCCSITTCIFVLVEFIRIACLPPFGSMLNKFMNSYIDSRDGGTVILTHIYLLIGIAIPVYCHTFVLHSDTTVTTLLPALAGILILGIGDSVASFVGTKFGTIKWFQSTKSVQGTVAAIISMLLSTVLIQLACKQYKLSFDVNWFGCVLSTVVVCLLEAFTSQIDNLMLPIIYYALLLLTQS